MPYCAADGPPQWLPRSWGGRARRASFWIKFALKECEIGEVVRAHNANMRPIPDGAVVNVSHDRFTS